MKIVNLNNGYMVKRRIKYSQISQLLLSSKLNIWHVDFSKSPMLLSDSMAEYSVKDQSIVLLTLLGLASLSVDRSRVLLELESSQARGQKEF